MKTPRYLISLFLLFLCIFTYSKLPSRPVENNCMQIWNEIFFWTTRNHSLHVTAYVVQHDGTAALGLYNPNERYVFVGSIDTSYQEWWFSTNVSKQVKIANNVSVKAWNRVLLDNYLILEFELPFDDFHLTEETQVFFFNRFQDFSVEPNATRSIPWFDEGIFLQKRVTWYRKLSIFRASRL